MAAAVGAVVPANSFSGSASEAAPYRLDSNPPVIPIYLRLHTLLI
jgi:hypothetical protein